MPDVNLRPAVPAHGRAAPAALVAKARGYVVAATWIYAATMPDNPHEYAVRQRAQSAGLGDGHEALNRLIRDYHEDRWWGGRTWRTIELDAWSLWIYDDGTVINRKPIDGAWDQARARSAAAVPPTLF